MDWISLSLALCMGLALSASCGFRVFVPLLLLALVARWDGVTLDDSLSWLCSDEALLCLMVATVLEISAFYIPWLDNVLSVIKTPLVLVAGTLMMGGVLAEQPDWIQWTAGVVGGASTAGVVHGITGILRFGSTATTGGLGNFVISTLENILAFVCFLLALVAPVLAVLVLGLLFGYAWRLFRRFYRRFAAAA